MSIKELKVGDKFSESFLVKNAEIKLTKFQKPYLALELYDGTMDVTSNIWDWNKPCLEKNTIIDALGIITEYNGNIQLNISDMRANTTLEVAHFAPQGGVDVELYLQMFEGLITSMTCAKLKAILTAVFIETKELWKIIPAAKKVHHAYIAGNLKHVVDVALKARHIALCVPEANLDLVTGGALLHDIGKLYTYCLNGAVIDVTDAGTLLDHIVIGTSLITKYATMDNQGLILLLQHIIASHHGKLEWGSPVTPKCIEAYIVHFADNLDAKTQTIIELNDKTREGEKFTLKEWSLDNQRMLSQNSVEEIMNS